MKNKNQQRKSFQKKGFQKKTFNSNRPSRPAIPLTLGEINLEKVGQQAIVKGYLEAVAQTSGPTLFTITDGSGVLVLKGFESPGERAYSFLEEGDALEATIQINEYNGSLEGEIKKINKLEGPALTQLKKTIKEIETKRAKPDEVDFLIKSPILDKLKDSFIKAATEIRLAVIQNRPIIVRHHNDADGYSSGYALERAILPLIEEQHGPGKAAWEFYLRAPCAAPFYEIDDSIRDTAMSLRNQAKFSNKMPLVIIADNGSSPEDLFAIQHGKVHGMEFIVVDHHYFDKDVISPEVLVHINPFLVEENGSRFSAGMLCAELARFINPVDNLEQIAAMAGLADRIDNPEAISAYLKLSEKQGYSKKLLIDIAAVIDFVSAKLRFMEAREYIESVFGEPREKQKELINLMVPYIRNLEKKGLEIGKSVAQTEKIGKTTLQYVYVEANFPGFGFYPKPGKTIGMLHDDLQENGTSNLVSIGIMNSAITIRATDEANFSVHELIEFLDEKNSAAFVNGGGHKNAGSITFLPAKQQEIFSLLKEFIKSRQ